MGEKLDFGMNGHYISAENIRLTLKALLKQLNDYRDNVPFDVSIEIKEIAEEG